MPKIKVTKIEFGNFPFRKIKNLSVPIAERVTLIAGHNGLGKSTLLAFLASNSGLIGRTQPTSYLGTKFKADLHEIIHIDYSEVVDPNSKKIIIGNPKVHYQINEGMLVKRCDVTARAGNQRARIVPRNDPPYHFLFPGEIEVGEAQKVPLPTLYLGMKRVLPVGEMGQRRIEAKINKDFDQEDKDFIFDFVNEVIYTDTKPESKEITTLKIKNTPKHTQHPKYAYHTQSISLGQDSLASIASAFASFKMLKRTMGDSYPGGLLLIDEIDVGFHPHAIGKLANVIKNRSRKLKLQVVATTHSPRMIEAFHPDSNGNHPSPDKVIYLHDSVHPQLATDQSLKAILADMNLLAPEQPPKPSIKIYFEDLEAHEWFTFLLPRTEINKISKKHNVQLDPFELGLGCKNLENLPSKDPYFQNVVIAVDADSDLPKGKKDYGNMIRLPGESVNSKSLSPERSLHKFLEDWKSNPSAFSEAKAVTGFQNISSDFINERFLIHKFNMEDRDSAKKWWRENNELIRKLNLIQAWAIKHQDKVQQLAQDLDLAVDKVAKRLK